MLKQKTKKLIIENVSRSKSAQFSVAMEKWEMVVKSQKKKNLIAVE